jgi:hypothetical protein
VRVVSTCCIITGSTFSGINILLNQLQKYFPGGKYSKNTGWYNTTCVFCQDTGYHMGINIRNRVYKCFKCNSKGKVKYLFQYIGKHFDSYVCNNETNVPNEQQLCKTKQLPNSYIPMCTLRYMSGSDVEDALSYTKTRIGLDLAQKLCVGYCTHGRFAHRLILPVYEEEVLVYYVGRSIYKHLKPKILNPEGDKGDIIFNWEIASKFDEIYVVEGPFDAIRLYPYGISLLGKEINEDQLIKIVRSSVKVINILLDGDAIPDAYKLASKIWALTQCKRIRVIELLKHQEPDTVGLEYILNLKKSFNYYLGINWYV